MIDFPNLNCSAMIRRIYQLMDIDLRLRVGGILQDQLLGWFSALRKMARLLQAHANLRSVEDAVGDSGSPVASAAARVSEFSWLRI